MHTITHTIRSFAHAHDDLPAFHAGYLILTILTAALFNLGTFALLIIAHMSLDLVKYRELHGYSWHQTISGTIRESLTDITLLMLGIVFAVYLHNTVGIASLSGLLRAEATVIRALGTLIPKMTILHNFLKIISHLRHYMQKEHPLFLQKYSLLEKMYVFALVISVILLILSVPLLGLTTPSFQVILLEELIPWSI